MAKEVLAQDGEGANADESQHEQAQPEPPTNSN